MMTREEQLLLKIIEKLDAIETRVVAVEKKLDEADEHRRDQTQEIFRHIRLWS